MFFPAPSQMTIVCKRCLPRGWAGGYFASVIPTEQECCVCLRKYPDTQVVWFATQTAEDVRFELWKQTYESGPA